MRSTVPGVVALLVLAACNAPSRTGATLERPGWATTTTTTTTTAVAPGTAPSATAPAEVTVTTTAPPVAPARDASWVCRSGATAELVERRHRAFVHNVSLSGIPVSSQAQVLRQLPLVEANLPLYCAAEADTGVPALVLAAIHYREAGNDPARSIMSGELLGAVNPDTHVVEGTAPLDNAVRAAEHLRDNAAAFYGVAVDAGMNSIDLAYALASYNRGGMYCRAGEMHPMRSPYVAGGITPDTIGMRWPDVGGAEGGPEAWGEPASVRGRPDPRIGALTLMRGLGSEITAPAFSWDTAEVVIACR